MLESVESDTKLIPCVPIVATGSLDAFPSNLDKLLIEQKVSPFCREATAFFLFENSITREHSSYSFYGWKDWPWLYIPMATESESGSLDTLGQSYPKEKAQDEEKKTPTSLWMLQLSNP